MSGRIGWIAGRCLILPSPDEAMESAESCLAYGEPPFSSYHSHDDDGRMRSTIQFLIERDRRTRFRGSFAYLTRAF